MVVRMDIVGAGRIGGALHAAGRAAGLDGALVSRAQGWAALERPAGTPVLVATRNDDLPAVLDRTPRHRHADLVFVQNGMLRPWLAAEGLADATRGILFVAVAARGAAPVVGGASPFHGPHASAVVAWLRAAGVDAAAVDDAAFRAVELEKLVWNCAFGVVCQARGVTVGEACDREAEAVDGLLRELCAIGAPALGVDVDVDALVERCVAYARAVAAYRAAVKEWPWRDGWFVAEAARRGLPRPRHAALLAEAGV